MKSGTLLGIDTELLFMALIALVAVERLFELWLSRRNGRRALAAGGREFGRGHYPVMVFLHSTFLLSALLEVRLFSRPFLPWLAGLSMVAVILSMALRYWVIHTLGERWTTRIFCRPGDQAVDEGPFRFLRHPNYLAVRVEMFFLPLVHTAFLTSIVYSLANTVLLRTRISAEERALGELTDWMSRFGSSS